LSQSILPDINGTYDRVTCNVKMDKDIEEAVMAIPAGDKEHKKVMQAIDEFEEGVKVTPQGDKCPFYCVKYCRGCELVCPVGK
jgi:epoxyqueuosine reductase